MSSKERTKELWHVPKRGNLHQTIGLIYILKENKINQKKWTPGNQEKVGSKLGLMGLTGSGKTITHQSVRTLLANIPKYLGFVYVNDIDKKVSITDAGYLLNKTHKINNILKQKKLSLYKANSTLIKTSEVFLNQMMKLIITNPVIQEDCQNVLLFPFRTIIKLLLLLDFIDLEEMAYLIMHCKSAENFELLLQQIKNFRTLSHELREKEISAYKNTPEGNLTLVQAPTSRYFFYLCETTGLCEVFLHNIGYKKLVSLRLKNKERANEVIKNFKEDIIYDFKNDLNLWYKYFANNNIKYPPKSIEIRTNSSEDLFLEIIDNKKIKFHSIINSKKPSEYPFFIKENYEANIFSTNAKKILSKKIKFENFNSKKLEFNNLSQTNKSDEINSKNIKEMLISKFGFDSKYYNKLLLLKKLTKNDYINSYYKGGRFEYLFYKILKKIEENNLISNLKWYGNMDNKYNLCKPAPGGIEGFPDITFKIDNFIFVLELTTIKGNRAQWNSAEASSVPDHINHVANRNQEKVFGIFSAPSIHHQIEENLLLNSNKHKYYLLCIEAKKLAQIIENYKTKKQILSVLLEEYENRKSYLMKN